MKLNKSAAEKWRHNRKPQYAVRARVKDASDSAASRRHLLGPCFRTVHVVDSLARARELAQLVRGAFIEFNPAAIRAELGGRVGKRERAEREVLKLAGGRL